jgi:hypothetical protein
MKTLKAFKKPLSRYDLRESLIYWANFKTNNRKRIRSSAMFYTWKKPVL